MKTIHESQQILVDNVAPLKKNGGAANTNAAGIGVPKSRRTSRQHSGYFFVRRHGNAFGWAVLCRAICAGSLTRDAKQYGSTHPDWRRDRWKDKSAVKEAIMPLRIRHALRVLFPLHAVPVSTVPTQAEARALGALLTSMGKRAVFYTTPAGFTVAEVAA